MRQPIFQPECGKTIPISFSERWIRSCRQKAIDKQSNKENQSFFSVRLPIQACYSWNSNSSHKLLKVWEGTIWIGLFGTYTPHPKYYKPDQCSSVPALESRSGQTQPLHPGTLFCDQWRGSADTGTALVLRENKPVVKVHFTMFFQDPAESSTLSQPWGESNSCRAVSFPSLTSSSVLFHSSLSHGSVDVQGVRQVDPARALSLASVKRLNMPKTYPCCLCTELFKKWCDQLHGYLWLHCSSWL